MGSPLQIALAVKLQLPQVKMKLPDQPLHFINHLEWRTWLQDHHASEKEAWLVIRKNKAISLAAL